MLQYPLPSFPGSLLAILPLLPHHSVDRWELQPPKMILNNLDFIDGSDLIISASVGCWEDGDLPFYRPVKLLGVGWRALNPNNCNVSWCAITAVDNCFLHLGSSSHTPPPVTSIAPPCRPAAGAEGLRASNSVSKMKSAFENTLQLLCLARWPKKWLKPDLKVVLPAWPLCIRFRSHFDG